MYQIKEVVLKNGEFTKKRSVITFDDPDMQIVGEFLMADAPMVGADILQQINTVLAGDRTTVESIGNRCAATIEKETTIITDLFEGMEGVQVYAPYKINTLELRDLIEMWLRTLNEHEKE